MTVLGCLTDAFRPRRTRNGGRGQRSRFMAWHLSRGSQRGVALLATLLITALLVAAAAGGTIVSRVDLFISSNLRSGVRAFWLAQAGAEVGKNWLEDNLAGADLPITLGPRTLGEGRYTIRIDAPAAGRYRITSTGEDDQASRRVVEEIISVPALTPLGVVTSLGDGLQPDFRDPLSSTSDVGQRIPDFSLDGRNRASDGSLSGRCADVAPFAVTQASAQTALVTAADALKQRLVTRANHFCDAAGHSTGPGSCTPGLAWLRGSAALPRFTAGACAANDPTCFVNLDLSAAALRATAQPAELHVALPPDDRGPFHPGTAADAFVRLSDAAARTQLAAAVAEVRQRIDALSDDRILDIAENLGSGTHTYGTPAAPRVTRIRGGTGPLRIGNGARLSGAGMLVVSRAVELGQASLDWRGLVLFVDDGAVRAVEPEVCGQILGAVVVDAGAAASAPGGGRFDLNRVTRRNCAPLAVNYSCETVTRALLLLQQTLSWTERLDT